MDYTGSLIFSVGCHSGLNVPDGEAATIETGTDWAQAFLRRGATFIGNTGFGYGDSDLIAYSELIMKNFVEELGYWPNNQLPTVGNALLLPFVDGTFDVVVCSEVLEHIPDYKQAVKEITRILKPGGKLAVSVPRKWPEKICWALAEGYHNTPGGHVRIFEASTLRSDIEGAGLLFFRKHWAHGLHSPYWWLQCLIWSRRDTSWAVKTYHRFLLWEILKRPLLTRLLGKIADPLMGKSVVLYFDKEQST